MTSPRVRSIRYADGTTEDLDALRAAAAEQERDKARSMLALAEGVAAALPDPDAQNPEHLRWAADFLALCGVCDGKARVTNDFGRALAHSGNSLIERAQRLEAAQSATTRRDREIEAAREAFTAASGIDTSPTDGWIEAAIAALDAARTRTSEVMRNGRPEPQPVHQRHVPRRIPRRRRRQRMPRLRRRRQRGRHPRRRVLVLRVRL